MIPGRDRRPPGVQAGDSLLGSVWVVPLSYWAYGLVRPLAFFAPVWAGTGSIGLGLVVVATLYVAMIRGSRAAWVSLVVLDSLALVGLLLLTEPSSMVVPLLTGFSWSLLLTPAARSIGAIGAKAPTATESQSIPLLPN